MIKRETVKAFCIDFLLPLLSAVTAGVIIALITGQPLSGLVKLKGLQTIILSTVPVPAWVFAPVFVFAVFALVHMIRHSSAHKPKGRIHFISDGNNTGWSKQTESIMNLRMGGAITYDGPDAKLVVLQIFLEGSDPAGFDADMEVTGGSGKRRVGSEIWLTAGNPVRGVLYTRLSPVLGVPGNLLQREVFFRDNLHRDFSMGPVTFPYIGPPR